MKTRLLILATFVLFSSLFMINESDALFAILSLEDLTEKAEFVVIGKVIEISPLVHGYLLLFSDGYDRFQFDVTLSIENDLDGKYGKDTIIFRIMDSREDFGMDIEDAQNFEVGERVLVFIGKKEPDSIMGDAYLVTGGIQGKYLLQDGIAFGIHFPEGMTEDELILKIQNQRSLNSSQNDELTDEQICGEGESIVNGICMSKSIWYSSDFRGLQTGESMSNPEVATILQSLGAILIVLFIVIYAIKKRMKKNKN